MNRQAIFDRAGGICGECGKRITDSAYDIDHIVPRSLGGSDDDENLRPTHRVCNRSKSANAVASWKVTRPQKDHRAVGELYDNLIGIPHYVQGVRSSDGNPFVRLSKVIDGGVGIRRSPEASIDELAHHGAYVTDAKGRPLRTGDDAVYVIWPHVAMRHPRYNGNLDTGLDRAKGEECGFVMTGKGTHARRLEMIARAAAMWLRSAR